MSSERRLHAITYHYVRDLPRTRFPRLKARLVCDFERQLDQLAERYEMATLESALAFLDGRYTPARDLCLLTFDDGLKEHVTEVLPLLAERRLQGIFFLITGPLEERRVISTHKSHFLMAALEFDAYRKAFLTQLSERSPRTCTDVDTATAHRAYRWDTSAVAEFRYLINFCLPEEVRDEILDVLFREYFGSEEAFARELYLCWDEVQQLQEAGMLIGGHSHSHDSLASLDPEAQQIELHTCVALMRARMRPQAVLPFSYPYGHHYAFDERTKQTLRELGVACAFTTERGANAPGQDRFALHRMDTNDV